MTEAGRLRDLAIARMPALSASGKARLSMLLGERPLSGLSRAEAEELAGKRIGPEDWRPDDWAREAERDFALLERMGAKAYGYFDPGYPAILRETSRPPFMLYVRGRLPAADRPALAIVGTRYPTGRGLDTAAGLAAEAAEAGVEVVSGLARGIDSAAHRGALAGGGATFAVLGSGIDAIYPPSNKALAARMLERGGGVLSEYPPGVPPSRWTFPERNRILAGLCRSLVVVEAPGASGALISASFALEEGRDVYVASACMGGPRSAGSDALAADGAQTLASFDDIIADWRGSGNPERMGGRSAVAPAGSRRWRAPRRRPGRRAGSTGYVRPRGLKKAISTYLGA